jgi:hypothetical protein
MAKKRPTPEEQLLDLIEKGETVPTQGIKRRKAAFLKRFWLSFKAGISGIIKRLKDGLKEPNLKVLNRIFLIICLGLIAYSVTDFIFKRPDINKVYRNAQLMIRKIKNSKIPSLVEQHPFLHYFEMVRRRNIFSPVVLKEEEKKPEVKKVSLDSLAKDLKLVGISWGKNPIVMIEDSKAKKTYFLKKGEMINEFKIDNILTDRVILSFGGETIQLM